jgi:very-short-patch-repair endonuclease
MPFHGTRAPRSDIGDFGIRCSALATCMRPGDVLTGPTAAKLWDIPLPRRFDSDAALHVGHELGTRQVRRAGVVGAVRVPDSTRCEIDGLPVIDAISCWLDLARVLEVPDLVAAGDFLVTGALGRDPLTTIAAIRSRVAGLSAGHRGVRSLRMALEGVRAGAWSRPESLLRWAILAANLPEPGLNRQLRLRGRRIVPDLWWRDFRLAVEYDGAIHGDQRQWARDLARSEWMADCGVRVVHVTSAELFPDPSRVVSRIARRLQDAGWAGIASVESPTNVRFTP